MCPSKQYSIIGLVISALAFGYGVYTNSRLRKAETVLDRSIDSLADDVEVEIPQELVDKAVSTAVNREVTKYVKQAAELAVMKVRDDMNRDIKDAVRQANGELRTAISEKMSDQVARLDMSQLKTEIYQKAQEKIVEKFESNLDSLLDDFNSNLTNISKIYGSIASTMTKRDDDTFLKLMVPRG